MAQSLQPNPTVKPIDPFAMPSQGEFNQSVLNAAKAQYEPALTQVGQDTQAEDATNTARNSYLNSLYAGYKQQVQGENADTAKEVNGLQTQENGLNTGANTDLGAAIGSSYGNANSLSALGLGQGASPQQLADYSSAANTSSQSDQDDLNGIAANLLAAGNRTLTNVAGERVQDLATQNQTHDSNLQQLQTAKSGIIDDIPGVLDQERNTLLTQLQNAQKTSFSEKQSAAAQAEQDKVAQEQIAIDQAKTAQTGAATTASIAHTRAADALASKQAAAQDTVALQSAETAAKNATTSATRVADQSQEAYYTEQLALDRINQQAATTNNKNQQGALKYISSWLAPGKSELEVQKGTIQLPGGGTGSQTTDQLAGNYQRNPASLIQALRSQYNMSRDQALTLVANVSAPLTAGANAETLGQWASQQLRAATSTPSFQGNPGYSTLTTKPPARLTGK